MLEFVLPGVSNQLHLLGRLSPSGESPTNQGATDIRRVYQQFRFRQAHPNYFPEYFWQLALWISPTPVEIKLILLGLRDGPKSLSRFLFTQLA
jgi:hypothetical protein